MTTPARTAPTATGAHTPPGADDLEPTVRSHLQRAAVYRLLALALSYPSEETLTEMATAARQLEPAVPDSSEPLRALASLAGNTEPTVLAGEYLRVFERSAPCSPREGSWTQQAVAARPALLADIAGFYAAFGMQLGERLGDSEDHIAAELEFLAFLSLKLAYAIASQHEEGAEIVAAAMLSFWRDHLARFVVPFAHALETTTTEDVYRWVARLLRQWSAAECQRLGVELRERGEMGPAGALEADCLVCPFADQP